MTVPRVSVLVLGWLASAGLGSSVAAEPPPAVAAKVRQVKVLADKAPDCSTLKTMVESVTRGCKSNDDKAIAIYNFMQLTNYHFAYPSEEGGLGALKQINVYGWSLCGGLHTIEASLWRELGWNWRFVDWTDPGHTTAEAQYDGRWHYLDSFLKFYTWMPNPDHPGERTIAGEDDIKADPRLVSDGLVFDKERSVYYHKGNRFEVIDGKANWRAPAFLVCGDEPGSILTGIQSGSITGNSTGWAGFTFDSPGYSTNVDLAAGSSLTLTWAGTPGAQWWNGRESKPGHTCIDKDYRNCPAIGPLMEPYIGSGGKRRGHANGMLVFAPDLADEGSLKGLAARENVKWSAGKLVPEDRNRPASITVELQSPYIMSRADGQADGVDSAEVSVDGGKTFQPIRLADFSEAVGGKYACLVKLGFKTALASIRLEAVVQCNRGALPYLSPGKNRITVEVADPRELGDNRLAVTYAYEVGSRSRSLDEPAESNAKVGQGHAATWSGKPTLVRKEFSARDLPASFDIEIPTPSDQHPVYPRMLFIRREILGPGAKPLPVPENAEPPMTGPGWELKTLPSPFRVGLAGAPK